MLRPLLDLERICYGPKPNSIKCLSELWRGGLLLCSSTAASHCYCYNGYCCPFNTTQGMQRRAGHQEYICNRSVTHRRVE